MKTEAVIFDIAGEQIISYIGMDPLKVVVGAIQELCDETEKQSMNEEEFDSEYFFARTTDARMNLQLSFNYVIKEFKNSRTGDELFVIVSRDRILAPIGFFRKL